VAPVGDEPEEEEESVNSNVVAEEPVDEQAVAKTPEIILFECAHCDVRFITERELDNHMGREHKCDLCDQVFGNQALLNAHRVKKHIYVQKKPSKKPKPASVDDRPTGE
jgi:uncharacterized C2H2 Zn-finger protein